MVKHTNSVIIIGGPTASGKTDASYALAEHFPIEIINADMGQMYSACSVGTAKPAWKSHAIAHHLFDIIDRPEVMTVSRYRMLVLDKIREVHERGNVPVLVGGSFFYLKSLFFPPRESQTVQAFDHRTQQLRPHELWERLDKIDPQRARKIHANDHYRLRRALDIWFKTGIKPSLYKPTFQAPFSVCFFVIHPKREELFKKINRRTHLMIGEGKKGTTWIDEVEDLHATEWDPFLRKKKLIGYPELLSWIDRGRKQDELDDVIKQIQLSTRHYAKRQICFWDKFKKQLEIAYEDSDLHCRIKEFDTSDIGDVFS